MGRFWAIGLCVSAAVSKKDVEKHLEEKSADDILKQLETKYQLADVYERSEKEDYYVYKLKTEILDKEYVPLIERFYSLRYKDDDDIDSSAALEKLKALPDSSSRLALLERKSFQTYQEGNDVSYFYPERYTSNPIRIYSNNAILSLDGKIIMECYNSVFSFFRCCIATQMAEFKLSQALTVWIDG